MDEIGTSVGQVFPMTLVSRRDANTLNSTPAASRPRDDGSGTAAADGRKSVALFKLPTLTEKSPVSRSEI